MYFDPLSAWLVSLIADGIIIAGDKSNKGAGAAFNQKCIEDYNKYLNEDIRRIKSKFGLILAEGAYQQIQISIRATKQSLSLCTNAYIIIDLDNQEYIIDVLEECAKRYSQSSYNEALKQYNKYSYDEAVKKAEWYKNAATEARQRKERYAKELEEAHIREAKEREKQQKTNNILLAIGTIILIIFIIFFFSY